MDWTSYKDRWTIMYIRSASTYTDIKHFASKDTIVYVSHCTIAVYAIPAFAP